MSNKLIVLIAIVACLVGIGGAFAADYGLKNVSAACTAIAPIMGIAALFLWLDKN